MLQTSELPASGLSTYHKSNYLRNDGTNKDSLQNELKQVLGKHYRRSAHTRTRTRRQFKMSNGFKSQNNVFSHN